MDKKLNIFNEAEVDLDVNGGPTNIQGLLSSYDCVILKPNKKGSKNVLGQWMVASAHTKYIIKYDFDLEDTIIEMPDDSILEIDCGSLQHGTLKGNNTVLLNTNDADNALVDIVLQGTWKESEEEQTAKMVDAITKHKVYITGTTLSQDMMPLDTGTDTIYVIKDNLTLTENINVPANCVLEFDGGNINGDGNITVDLNYAPLKGEPKLINCKVSNPYQKVLKFSWLGIGADSTYNTATFSWLATKNIDWVVDTDCEINSSITVTNRINISSPFVDGSALKTITFPNSAGIIFSANPYHNQTCIENFILIAKGDAIKYTGYAYNTYIKNIRVQSDEGNAITFANNFQVHISDCWLYAPEGYCVDNLRATTSSVTRVSIGACKAAYHNCETTWISCNGVYNADIHNNPGTTKNWYLWDSTTANYGIKLTLINCNIESIVETPILSTSAVANSFVIRGCNTTIYSYKDSITGKREYPIIKVRNLRYFDGVTFAGGVDDFADGVYPIVLTGNIDNYNPLFKFDYLGPVYIKANNKEGEYTSNYYSLPTSARPSTPMEGFTYYDTTLHKQVWYNSTNWVDGTGTPV